MQAEKVAELCGALALLVRLEIFSLLVRYGSKGLPAREIAAAVQAAPLSLSFHFKTMVHAGLLVPHQEGRYVYYAVNFHALRGMVDYLTAECCTLEEAGNEQCLGQPDCRAECG